MTQAEPNRAVAGATGESVRTIAEMGFLSLTALPVEREPLTVDRDRLDAERVDMWPHRGQRKLPAV